MGVQGEDKYVEDQITQGIVGVPCIEGKRRNFWLTLYRLSDFQRERCVWTAHILSVGSSESFLISNFRGKVQSTANTFVDVLYIRNKGDFDNNINKNQSSMEKVVFGLASRNIKYIIYVFIVPSDSPGPNKHLCEM